MEAPTILPDPAHLHLLGFVASVTRITAVVATTAAPAPGPVPPVWPGEYARPLAVCAHAVQHDLPWHGVAVQLERPVRRFFCDNPACRQTPDLHRAAFWSPGVLCPPH